MLKGFGICIGRHTQDWNHVTLNPAHVGRHNNLKVLKSIKSVSRGNFMLYPNKILIM